MALQQMLGTGGKKHIKTKWKKSKTVGGKKKSWEQSVIRDGKLFDAWER